MSVLTSFSLQSIVLDIVYPPTCVGCSLDGGWLCEVCLRGIYFARPSPDHSHLVVVGFYAEPSLRRLLTYLKYRSATCLTPALRELVRLFRRQRQTPWPWVGEEVLSICTVPSDQHRVRQRGSDHVQSLETIVHEEIAPWATRKNLLRRTKRVIQNAALPANELREANVQDVFAATSSIQGAVLLIDDVYTTGATWHEAERVLKEAGASSVYGFVFAKG